MISKGSQDDTLCGREGQALIKATVSVLDSECVYECESVYTACFWYLQDKASHAGNKLCKSKSDLRSTKSLNLAE